ncbi:MAG: 30S ribosomal protein S17e [Candidatus Hermodarchaeota archaeon]
MGKVRPSNIKTLARIIVKQYEEHLSEDFDENKILIEKIVELRSKRFRNSVAGYVTRLMRRKAKELEEYQ